MIGCNHWQDKSKFSEKVARQMNFQKASVTDFHMVRKFYWNVIDDIHRNNVKNENLGWKKGVYPSDSYIQSSLIKGELYTLTEKNLLYACVILNREHNEGYHNCAWSIDCDPNDVLIPHTLAVDPALQGKGIGKIVVENIRKIAKKEQKRAIRLDVLGACKAAEYLYLSCGFQFVEAKIMYCEDTGWTEFKMFELNL